MTGGGEPGHVQADLGDDALGGGVADPGDLIEPLQGRPGWRVWVIGIGHRDHYHQQCLTACELARRAAPLEGDGKGKPSAVTDSTAMH